MARMSSNSPQIQARNVSGRELVQTVRRDLGRSQKQMAIDAGCPESDLSNALSGKQRFDMQWLLNQDDEFLIKWWREVEIARGLTPRAKRAIKRMGLLKIIDALLDDYEEQSA
jgi:hypothetical protein